MAEDSTTLPVLTGHNTQQSYTDTDLWHTITDDPELITNVNGPFITITRNCFHKGIDITGEMTWQQYNVTVTPDSRLGNITLTMKQVPIRLGDEYNPDSDEGVPDEYESQVIRVSTTDDVVNVIKNLIGKLAADEYSPELFQHILEETQARLALLIAVEGTPLQFKNLGYSFTDDTNTSAIFHATFKGVEWYSHEYCLIGDDGLYHDNISFIMIGELTNPDKELHGIIKASSRIEAKESLTTAVFRWLSNVCMNPELAHKLYESKQAPLTTIQDVMLNDMRQSLINKLR